MKAKIDVPIKIRGEVEYELEDTRTGEVTKGKQKNLLLNDYLNMFFTEDRYHLGFNIFRTNQDTCYLGDSDVAPDRSQTGLQGATLASKSADSNDL